MVKDECSIPEICSQNDRGYFFNFMSGLIINFVELNIARYGNAFEGWNVASIALTGEVIAKHYSLVGFWILVPFFHIFCHE
jgi:hypothetical protein